MTIAVDEDLLDVGHVELIAQAPDDVQEKILGRDTRETESNKFKRRMCRTGPQDA